MKDWFGALWQGLQILPEAVKTARVIKAEGEAASTKVIVARMHARYEQALKDPAVADKIPG